MRTVLLVPRRMDNGHRDELWRLARARWTAILPDVPIYEGHHTDGPFNRSAAINAASELADLESRWDVAVVIDSDVMVRRSQVQLAIDAAAAGQVTWAHRRWRELSEYWTRRTLADRQTFGPEFEDVDLDVLVEKTTPISWSCCVAIPRAAFDSMGGFDERFRGWGFEDGAWAALVRGLYSWGRIPGDVINLWHPRSPERIVLGESRESASADYVRNALLGRRYQIAVIRDHRVGDQPGEEAMSEELAAVHVANLTLDDARFLKLARDKGMPEARWADWWPTLEELRDGWRSTKSGIPTLGPTPTVTAIVRTGGEPDTWAARSVYLRASLGSFAKQVSGPIVQRVIYSDWGLEHRDELAAIAAEHGFYVAGSEQHQGFGAAVRSLWSYISRRVQGDFVFLTEDDFIYDRPVDLAPMIESLRRDSRLRQIALLRDPYPSEVERGGILGWPAESFEARDQANGHGRLEHRNFWTMNPSLVRREITEDAWPVVESSERRFGDTVFRDPSAKVAFWGDGAQWVTHIGKVRSASAY